MNPSKKMSWLICFCGASCMSLIGCGIQGEKKARIARLSTEAATATVSEPSYCEPEVFRNLEISPPNGAGLDRLKLFKINNRFIAGLGVGNSNNSAVRGMARELSAQASGNEAGPGNRFCTWYNNKGSQAAAASFTQRYFSKRDAQEGFRTMRGSFSEESINMTSCLEENGYIAIGCDGMRHRGPTAFGMFLAFSGCSPDHSNQIVNRLWGTHGVASARRQAIQLAYDHGSARPAERKKLQALLTEPAPAPSEDSPLAAGERAGGAPDTATVSFKTPNGQYVSAENGGKARLLANGATTGARESFTLVDLNGGSLADGDFIALKASNRLYAVAEDGGGSSVRADRTSIGPWETFTLIKVSGSGSISSGDSIALRSHNGSYVAAEGGGGGLLNADRPSIGAWETFVISLTSGSVR